MKTLTQYIKDNRTKQSIIFPKNKQFSEYTFEEFCNDVGKTNLSTNELWSIYENNKCVPLEYIDKFGNYDDWFFESELYVSEPDVVEAELNKYDKYFDKIEKVNVNKTNSKFYFFRLHGDIDKLIKMSELDSFIKLMNLSNWSAYLSGNKISIKPNKTHDITDKVYSFDYIYHYCPKFIYENNISKFGINPKHKFASKYEKIYCFYSKSPSDDMQQWARIKYRLTDNKYKKELMKRKNFVVLKIDLSKCSSKIRFWEDEESNSQYAFYTFEPIPPFAIVDVIDMNVKLL